MRGSMVIAVVAMALGCSSGSGGGGTSGAAGGGSGGGAGQCPDVAGTWTIESSCQSSQVGAKTTLTQTGCTAVDDEGTSIALAADGSFAWSGKLPDGTPISCSGTATSSSISQTCDVGGQQCPMTLGK